LSLQLIAGGGKQSMSWRSARSVGPGVTGAEQISICTQWLEGTGERRERVIEATAESELLIAESKAQGSKQHSRWMREAEMRMSGWEKR